MYRVIKFFTDLQDNNHAYNVGDIFPHNGMEVSEKRLLELSTDKNRRHMPLIEKAEDEKPVEPVEDFMNPPEEPTEEVTEIPEAKDAPKSKKKRGRPRNDAE